MDTLARGQDSDLIIAFQGVTKAFGPKVVLRDLDLGVRRGETLAILGTSGSGKSVTLRHIVGLMQADSGRVVVDGEDVARMDAQGLHALRRKVALIFQGNALFDSMNIADNVAFGLRARARLTEREIAARVSSALEQVDLHGVEASMPADLSGGMRKRVALARSMVLEPVALLYDEPTSGLDPVTGQLVSRLIKQTGERSDMTSIVVTHDIPSAFLVADRMALLAGGSVVFHGTPAEARRSPGTAIHDFLYAYGEEGLPR